MSGEGLHENGGGPWSAIFRRGETHWKSWLILFVLLGLGLRLCSWSYFLCENDSYFFILMAHNVLDHGSFAGTLGEGGDFYLPARVLTYKWLYPLLMASLLPLFDGEVAGHLVALASGVLFTPAIFFATRAITGDVIAGLAAALLACFSYSNATWAGNVLPDSLCTLMLTLALWQGLGRGERISGALGAGIFSACAAATRAEMAILIPAALIATLAASRRMIVRRAVIFCLGAALVCLPVYHIAMKGMGNYRSRPSAGSVASKKLARISRALSGHGDARHVIHFVEEEAPLFIALLFTPAALVWRHRRISRRYLAYAAYHVGGLATIYNLWINESVRYYTHLLPALMPLGALGLATLLRARPEKMLPRASRTVCVLGVLLGIAAQSGKIMYEGHRRPGYEKEAALVIRNIVDDLKRSRTLRGNPCIVSHNRFAMHALTGLPSTGYRASRGKKRYIVRKEERDMFAQFLVVVDAHLRRLDPGIEVMGSHFADRRVGAAHIPISLAPSYREQGFKFTDDLFEFYLLSREDVEELLALEARWEEERGRVVHGTSAPPQEPGIGTKARQGEGEVAIVPSPASFPRR